MYLHVLVVYSVVDAELVYPLASGKYVLKRVCTCVVWRYDFYQVGEHSAPGWSCSYFAIFVSVCLSVRLCMVWGGLGLSYWRQLARMVVSS